MEQLYIIDVFDQDSEELKNLRDCYKEATFSPGVMTITRASSKVPIKTSVKNNLEMDDDTPDVKSPMYKHYLTRTPYWKCHAIIEKAVKNSEIYNATLMDSYSNYIFSRYIEGGYYNTHVDHGKMGMMRTDYSVTIFVNDPEDYDGGELCIDIGSEELKYKLKAGQAIVYPTGLKHHVNEVTRGQRDVCVFWIKSAILDETIRGIYRSIWTIHNKYLSEPDALQRISDECFALEHQIVRKFAN